MPYAPKDQGCAEAEEGEQSREGGCGCGCGCGQGEAGRDERGCYQVRPAGGSAAAAAAPITASLLEKISFFSFFPSSFCNCSGGKKNLNAFTTISYLFEVEFQSASRGAAKAGFQLKRLYFFFFSFSFFPFGRGISRTFFFFFPSLSFPHERVCWVERTVFVWFHVYFCFIFPVRRSFFFFFLVAGRETARESPGSGSRSLVGFRGVLIFAVSFSFLFLSFPFLSFSSISLFILPSSLFSNVFFPVEYRVDLAVFFLLFP